jgi:hypothetical protein
MSARNKEMNTHEEDVWWELQGDLATVSCYAAGEIDSLILGHQNGFSAVKRLLGMIREALFVERTGFSPESLIDPTTAVAMNHALEGTDPTLKGNLKTVDQLIQQSHKVVKLLDRVSKNPSQVKREKPDQLKKLRSLCIALSGSALAYETPIDEVQPQTF